MSIEQIARDIKDKRKLCDSKRKLEYLRSTYRRLKILAFIQIIHLIVLGFLTYKIIWTS